MRTEKERLARLEDRVSNMMSAMRILQRQVVLLTQLEQTRGNPTDPVSEIKRRIVHAAREERMRNHPYFGDD